METSLRPQPLIAEVLPGFTTLFILTSAYFIRHPDRFNVIVNDKSAAAIIAGGFTVLLLSWVIGTVFDAIRDIFEHLLDCWFPVNWGFLLHGTDEQIRNLNDSWLAYYFLTGSFTLALSVTALCGALIPAVQISFQWLLAILAIVLISGADAVLLRREIRRLIGYQKGTLPHDAVYTRLRPSTAAPSGTLGDGDPGVGVFAIRDIPKGTLVFAPDDDETVCVRLDQVRNLPVELRRLYEDFCVLKGGTYNCPTSFNKLTPAWYLNNSNDPNVAPDESLRFVATRNIAPGDELTAHYEDYSDNEKG